MSRPILDFSALENRAKGSLDFSSLESKISGSEPSGVRVAATVSYPDIPGADTYRATETKFEDKSQERTLQGFLGNILSSGGRMVKDVATAVTSPVQTAKAVGGLAAGLGEKLIPGEQGHEQNVDAIVKMYSERYGSWDDFTKTLYEDPVGVLADLSTVAGGCGSIAKGLGVVAKTAKLGKAASLAADVGKTFGTISEVTDPVRMVARSATALASRTGVPERLYESALKPSLGKKNLPKIAGEIQTGLKEGMPVSAGGSQRIADAIDELQTDIKDEIAASARAGATIRAEDVVKRVDDLKNKFGAQVNPKTDLAALESSKQEFLKKYEILDPQGKVIGYKPIPVAEAQESKIATYAMLKDKSYGELKGASIEAQKALARGIKEELVTAIPELKDLNLRESKLLQLEPVIEKAVARIRNHQLFGIGTPLAAAGAEAVTGNYKIALAAAALRAVIEQPQIKSRLAIALNSIRKRNPSKYGRPIFATAVSRVQEYVDSLGGSQGGP